MKINGVKGHSFNMEENLDLMAQFNDDIMVNLTFELSEQST